MADALNEIVANLSRRELERLSDEACRYAAQREYERDLLLQALKEIAKAEGRFSRDHCQHAMNTVEDMQTHALDAIAKFKGESNG